jgi:hypothetical protein
MDSADSTEADVFNVTASEMHGNGPEADCLLYMASPPSNSFEVTEQLKYWSQPVVSWDLASN